MSKYIIKAFLLIAIPIVHTGCVLLLNPPQPYQPDPPIFEVSYIGIVEFNDSTYADRILAYAAAIPHNPDRKLGKMIVNVDVFPNGFLENPYNPWEKIMGNYYTILPFSAEEGSSFMSTLWPLIGNGNIGDLHAISAKWIDFSHINYTYGYENYYDATGTLHSIYVLQLPPDTQTVSNPIKAVYKLNMDTVYNYFQVEPCKSPNRSAEYCEYVRQMLLESKENGNLDELLDNYKAYPISKITE